MIRNKKLPENILNLIPKVEALLKDQRVVMFAYLFGGFARSKVFPLSDIDVAVYLEEGSEFATCKLNILGKLMAALGTDEIDLVILNTAPLTLRIRVICNKKVLVDKNPPLRYSFESLVLREHFDFSKKEEELFKRRFSIGR